MKKLIFFSAMASLLICTASFAQIAGNAAYNGTAYTGNNYNGGVDLSLQPLSYGFGNILEASVMVNVKASAYVAIFSVTQHGATIEETEQAMNNRIAIFKNNLLKTGIDEKQIFVDAVSLVPQYETQLIEKKFSKTLNEVPDGFEMKKNVHISFTIHAQMNELITAAARAEVYDLVKVDYVVDDMQQVLNQLRDNAMAILMAKKAVMEKAGLRLRISQMGERYGSAYPAERYAQYTAYKTGIEPRFVVQYKKGVAQQQVQYNYAEKNKTIYYDKVPDKQFDLILNPVVAEPEVQVYLSVKAQYEKYNPDTEAADLAYAAKLRSLELATRELELEAKRRDLGLAKKKD